MSFKMLSYEIPNFGFCGHDKSKYNFILLLAKYYSYNCKWDSIPNGLCKVNEDV